MQLTEVRRLVRVAAALTEVVAVGLIVLALSSATPATAAHVARLDVTPAQVAPGDQVTVSRRDRARGRGRAEA